MNKIHKQRLYYVAISAICLAFATSLILYALKKNINMFLTSTQLASMSNKNDYHVRLGGMVKKQSVIREKNGLNVHFIVTDYKSDIPVHYVGILPDLFREGKGVITEGQMSANGMFIATQVLAKHDENYMPKNIAKALQEGKT
jgi:cytochrome c-type biogenesis protein CcmE